MPKQTRTRNTRKPNTITRNANKPSKIVVGYIHADWCGHCTALKPVWAQMQKIIPQHLVVYEDINSNYQDARIAKLNKTHGVNMSAPQGYPYIFKISDGKIHEYSGERNAKKMADWFRGKGQPTVPASVPFASVPASGPALDPFASGQASGPASGPAMTDSAFGAGMFRGGLKKKKKQMMRRHTVGKRSGRIRGTQKSFFSRLFGN